MDYVSCIIPTYNEEERLPQVLRAVVSHPLVQEIIVVDDASTDATQAILAQYPHVTVIRHEKNTGKTMSLYDGINSSTSNVLLLLDADLIGLTADNVTDLITPVINHRCDITISLRKNATFIDRMIGIDYISGERVFYKSLIADHLAALPTLPRFGFEVFFNSIIMKRQYRLCVVPWRNVISPYPTAKFGFREGSRRFMGMIRDIVKTISLPRVMAQYLGMYRLKRKYERS